MREIDKKVAHFSRLLSLITDTNARDGIAGLTEKMNAEKAALHPEPEEN
jgi:hypothetical protein